MFARSAPLALLFTIFTVACSSEVGSDNRSKEAEVSGFPASLAVIIKGGPVLDEGADRFRIRKVPPDFIWVVSRDYEVRMDPWFRDGDGQIDADELGNRNTLIRYFDSKLGRKVLCGKDWEQDVVGDFRRDKLTEQRIEASFRFELDKCTVDDEVLPGKVITASGRLSLPRTDRGEER